MRILEVGGSVRDELLGLNSKDKDFVVVLDDISKTVDQGFDEMKEHLVQQQYQIFLETRDCYTIRAKFPIGHSHEGLVADFVLARKEIGYIKGTRNPILVLGTIEDDIFRRDFRCNALFRSESGEIIDLTGSGIGDINRRFLMTPLDPLITFQDDPLRIFRGLRFAITKGFHLSPSCMNAMRQDTIDFSTVSLERVREELYKCFKHDTLKTLKYLQAFPKLQQYAFGSNELWLKPHMGDK